jgi:signal peptidase I
MRFGRVIGLPGDRIAIKEGILSINGQSAKRTWFKDYRCKSARCQRKLYRQYTETLPDAFIDPYRVIDTIDGGPGENLAEFTVPPGHYFILGDHRDHQENALSGQGHGLIARDQLFGLPTYRYFRGYDRKVVLELIP